MSETTLIALVSGGLAGAIVNVLYRIYERYGDYAKRPKPKLLPYEHKSPFYRKTMESLIAADGNEHSFEAYYVNVGVSNSGKQVAERCEALVTAYAFRKQNRWIREENWIPIPLRWALDELLRTTPSMPLVQRSIAPDGQIKSMREASVPIVRYFLNLGSISERHLGTLELTVGIRPNAQKTEFEYGEYCFEVTLASENGDWDRSWYHFEFKPGPLSEALDVSELSEAPW